MTTGDVRANADVDLVLDFLNTLNVEAGADLLDDPGGRHAWLAARGLSDDDSAGAVRAALRVAVGDRAPGPAMASAQVTVSLDAAGPKLVADEVSGAVLAAACRLAVLGDWDRIKICPADDCRWAFFDRSRNHSRTWCSMRACGNREKARAWRERARAGGSHDQLRHGVDQQAGERADDRAVDADELQVAADLKLDLA